MGRDKLFALYRQVTNCPNTCRDCPGINRSKFNPPRGFFNATLSGRADVLVVGKNPGHAVPSETKRYKAATGKRNLTQLTQNFARDCFLAPEKIEEGKSQSLRFHRNLIACLTEILQMPTLKLFKKVAYTNLVKCSTTNEQGSLSSKLMRECGHRFLLKEIALIKPKVIIALGDEVDRFLHHRDVRLGLPPVLYLKHTSRYLSKIKRAETLERLRREVRKLL